MTRAALFTLAGAAALALATSAPVRAQAPQRSAETPQQAWQQFLGTNASDELQPNRIKVEYEPPKSPEMRLKRILSQVIRTSVRRVGRFAWRGAPG